MEGVNIRRTRRTQQTTRAISEENFTYKSSNLILNMGRRGRASSPMSSRRASPPPAPRQSVPAHAPPAAPMMAGGQPRQPGMMAQMAATAGGVAIGSTVGHVVGHAITGGMGGSSAPQEVAPQQAAGQPAYNQQQMSQPCEYEMRQFLECTQTQSDLSMCTGINEILKDCKLKYNIH